MNIPGTILKLLGSGLIGNADVPNTVLCHTSIHLFKSKCTVLHIFFFEDLF